MRQISVKVGIFEFGNRDMKHTPGIQLLCILYLTILLVLGCGKPQPTFPVGSTQSTDSDAQVNRGAVSPGRGMFGFLLAECVGGGLSSDGGR